MNRYILQLQYEVTATYKCPAYGCCKSHTNTFLAKDRKEAIKMARDWMKFKIGHTRQDGALLYTAKII